MHIGYGVLVVLPLINVDGSLMFVILFRTFTAEPASPIVQVRQILNVHGKNSVCILSAGFQKKKYTSAIILLTTKICQICVHSYIQS